MPNLANEACDLSNPETPEVLGYLKVTGYSSYLHPYDENHIIGIGKEAVANSDNENFAWYQGVKIALFDVSDVSNPREIDTFEIGDRGTDSIALQEHKAFLFDREKNLLVLPILLAEIDAGNYVNGNVPAYAYGEQKFGGAYVFRITLTDGIQEQGRISHSDTNEEKTGQYYDYYSAQVRRSLFMDNYLYTLSNNFLKANNLASLKDISSIEIELDQGVYFVGGGDMVRAVTETASV